MYKEGGVLLPRQFLQSSYYEHHVNRRALGSEPILFLRQNVLAFSIVTQATRDDSEEYFAGSVRTPSPTSSTPPGAATPRCITSRLSFFNRGRHYGIGPAVLNIFRMMPT